MVKEKNMTGYQAIVAAYETAQQLTRQTGLLIQVRSISFHGQHDSIKADWYVRLPSEISKHIDSFELSHEFETTVQNEIRSQFGSETVVSFLVDSRVHFALKH